MPVEISWQQPRRVIYERFYENVTIDELTSIQQKFFQFLADGDAPVHSIIDLSAVRDFPKSINQVRHALAPDPSGKAGRVVIVIGSNPLVKFITYVISQVLFKDAQFTFCNSLGEAVNYLRLIDSSVTIEQLSA